MTDKMKIGVVGQGFVGSAIREGLKDFYDIYTYDLNLKLSNCESLIDVVKNSDIIFVCLPTPMKSNGCCHTGVVEGVISDIDEMCGTNNYKDRIIVIKSTVPPGTTRLLNTKYKHVSIVFSPEFLTEANSFNDFKNQSRIIVGGSDGQTYRYDRRHASPPISGKAARKVKQMLRKPFPYIPIVVTKSETAEMVKYFINCFLASKVTFANQMYDICESSNIDYDKVCKYAMLDKRVGSSHLAVPGPDGDRGFGGHCFPKDLGAMIYFSHENNVSSSFLEQVEKSNSDYRSNKDWLMMKGRAVSED